MVKQSTHIETAESWIAYINQLREGQDISLIGSAVELCKSKDPLLLKDAIEIADILLNLKMDNETLAAGILFPFYKNHEIHHDTIAEKFGENIEKLLTNATQMQSFDKFQYHARESKHQVENIRKMLLAMVSDIRAVILILSEKLLDLRRAKYFDNVKQRDLAKKTLAIFGPLANRLGIWQLKWEMEDLSLRYLEPEKYKSIARSLESKRNEREAYIQTAIELLTKLLQQHSIKHFKVNGRVKHIYSIYNKMRRKNADFSQIYDIRAFRILVDSIDDCYQVLSILQNEWDQILEEFDDYISQPKQNGYQSLHTVLIGPSDRVIEIQIRTYEMHQSSEIGVASHWQYKEGVRSVPVYEEKIALLRQMMAWENEVIRQTQNSKQMPVEDLFADRVYVFTPLGDIIDLPKGATPLDFAYHIHSEVGHRCRGAKVDGKLVQLTYPLQTGQRIDIMTAKQANPSRDWLNPHLGYVHTVKARSHLNHWFRHLDRIDETEAAPKAPSLKPVRSKAVPLSKAAAKEEPLSASNLRLKNYLTKIARCCHPKAGDDIIGYITQKNELSIHKTNCKNIKYLKNRGQFRFLEIDSI